MGAETGGAPDFATLLTRAQAGDQGARDRLVQDNLRLVWSVVGRFQGRGVEAEDLFQVGAMGLMRAVDRFDLSYGVRFSTYAVPLIIGEIRRYLRDQGTIKVSRTLKERATAIMRTRDALSASLMREATADEIAAELGLTPEDVVEAMEAQSPVGSLEDSIGRGEREDQRLMDVLPAPEQEESRLLERLALLEAMGHISSEEQRVLYLRFYRDMTQTEVASVLGTNQVRVSRLERRALMKLRAGLDDS